MTTLTHMWDTTSPPNQHLLDIEGGGAAHEIALCRACSRIRRSIFDLPFAIDWTRKWVVHSGFHNRVSLQKCDFLNDSEVPEREAFSSKPGDEKRNQVTPPS